MKRARFWAGSVLVFFVLSVLWFTRRPAAPVDGERALAPTAPEAGIPPVRVSPSPMNSAKPPRETSPVATTAKHAPANALERPALPASPSGNSSPQNPAPVALPPMDLRTEMEAVQTAIRDYRTALGGNPVGNNREITKALLGDNLKQIKIPVPPGSQLNGKTELCDRWGTPYFFHALSATRMEIRSAGPDHQMWTADDVQK